LVLCVDEKSQIQALDREQPVLPMMPGMPERRTHKTPAVKPWLARRPHWHVHFTPTSGSWINPVERSFAELTRKQLQRGVHRSVAQLEADIRAFIERHNDNPKPFKWTKSADEILASYQGAMIGTYSSLPTRGRERVSHQQCTLVSVKRFCQKTEHALCSEL
jgi:hypothetical protein